MFQLRSNIRGVQPSVVVECYCCESSARMFPQLLFRSSLLHNDICFISPIRGIKLVEMDISDAMVDMTVTITPLSSSSVNGAYSMVP